VGSTPFGVTVEDEEGEDEGEDIEKKGKGRKEGTGERVVSSSLMGTKQATQVPITSSRSDGSSSQSECWNKRAKSKRAKEQRTKVLQKAKEQGKRTKELQAPQNVTSNPWFNLSSCETTSPAKTKVMMLASVVFFSPALSTLLLPLILSFLLFVCLFCSLALSSTCFAFALLETSWVGLVCT